MARIDDYWGKKAQTIENLVGQADSTAKQNASAAIRRGHAGRALMRSTISGEKSEVPPGFLVDQGDTDSSLIIGPLRYAHSVQDISLSEEKAVFAPPLVRSDRPLLIDSGVGLQRASVSLLFTGLEEINRDLRALIALFKSAPITVSKNELISASWGLKPPSLVEKAERIVRSTSGEVLRNKEIADITRDLLQSVKDGTLSTSYLKTFEDKLSANKETRFIFQSFQSLLSLRQELTYVPVALERLSLQTVPDIPDAIIATLTLTRVDLSSVTENGVLKFLNEDFGPTPHPQNAYWLKKYLHRELKGHHSFLTGRVTEEDFSRATIKFFHKTLRDVRPLDEVPEDIVLNIETDTSKLIGQSCTIENRYGYQRLVGKPYPSPHHMGGSARALSLDFQFDTLKDDKLERIRSFIEASDSIIRSEAYIDRAMGWEVEVVTTKLMGGSQAAPNDSEYGVFVPLSINTNTTNVPGQKNLSLSLAETNTQWSEVFETILEDGGTDITSLRQLFFGIHKDGKNYGILPGERRIREQGVLDRIAAQKSSDPDYRAYSIFWPVTPSGSFSLIQEAMGAVVNRDTIRAALLSKEFDKDGELRKALLETPLFSGVTKTRDDSPFLLKLTSSMVNDIGLATPTIDSDKIGPVSEVLLRYIDRMFILRDRRERTFLANSILASLAGEPQALDDLIEKMASGTRVEFSQDFLEAIFYVVTRRPSKIPGLPHVYDVVGLHSAFETLYREYSLHKDLYPGLREDADSLRNLNTDWRRTTYQDFIYLPTYKELFGDKWPLAAPTFDDLGVSYKDDRDIYRPVAQSLEENQSAIAVLPDDKVPPHIFFYSRRRKGHLRNSLKNLTDNDLGSILDSINRLYLSLNYTSPSIRKKIKGLEQQTAMLERIASSPDTLDEMAKGNAQARETIKALEDIILEGLRNDSADGYDLAALEDDLDRTKFLGEEDKTKKSFRLFYEKYFAPDRLVDIPIYITVAGHADGETKGLSGFVDGKTQLSSTFGGALIRVMHERRWAIKKRVPFSSEELTPAQDEFLVAEGNPRLAFGRNLKNNIKYTLRDSLSQIPDDSESLSRLWPTAKVYFVDRRGDDLISQDVLRSTDGILSIDVVLDKEDAATAVIRIADPMRIVQSSKPAQKHTANLKGNDGKNHTVVLGPSKRNLEGLIKQKNITQGRAVVIKMGYDSVPSNLTTVFTGRITEVEVGDVLTIVCQEWKAELINRYVNFYTSKKKNWSAKDLAILAIQQADPDGFGERFTEYQLQSLLNAGESLDLAYQIDRLMDIQKDTSNVYGRDSLFAWILANDGISNFLDLDDTRSFPGLDTRLKNIWYPDTSINISNFLNFRRLLKYPPTTTNDYWLVPLQPCWNVLQEAARHTWGYIVQTVPYDNESTIFFGHPDGLYYYTRGVRKKVAQYRKTASNVRRKSLNEVIGPLVSDFLRNEFHSVFPITSEDFRDKIRYGIRTDIPGINSTNIAVAKYKDLKNIVGSEPMYVVYQVLFGIDPTEIRTRLSPFETLQPIILSRNGDPTADILFEEHVATNQTPLYKLSPYYSEKSGGAGVDEIVSLIDRIPSFLNSGPLLSSVTELRGLIEDNPVLNRVSSITKTAADLQSYISSELVSVSTIGPVLSSGTVRPTKDQKNKIAAMLSTLRSRILRRTSILPPEQRFPDGLPIVGDLDPYLTLGELLTEHRDLIRSFVYRFTNYIQAGAKEALETKVTSAFQSIEDTSVAPTLRTFRVHHYIDSDRDIISNKIAASTAQMWNTVVINYPASDPVDTSTAEGASTLYRGATVSNSTSWVYWPPTQISKVIGLQFHPGITLSNKKLRSFTELSCSSEPLAARLACNRLAEGMRKMYVGELSVKGRHIKPYDRIVLRDTYNEMSGPLEVGSVIHHYSPDIGWVTNISPCTICEANPGASVVQTAISEAMFSSVMRTVDWLVNGAMVVSFLASPFAGAAFAALRGSMSVGTSLLKGLFIKGALKGGLGGLIKTIFTRTASVAGKISGKGAISSMIHKYSLPTITLANRVAGSYLLGALANSGLFMASNIVNTSAWVDGNKDPSTLPVILTPLMLHGTPWTAGLEADETLFSVPFFDTYYSYADFLTWLHDSVQSLGEKEIYPR
ncbi:MAG: hypothetical protein D6698_03335 [Gammaproteobacteria bacterium]|nr:MAG: hypothetical protein D6698_03335 [Gammaproteobacteria bacterium]